MGEPSRRGVDCWAWLSGTGTIRAPSDGGLWRSRPGDDRLIVDLLFTAPDVTRIPRISRTERAQRGGSLVMQLPSIGSQPVVLGLNARAARQSFV